MSEKNAALDYTFDVLEVIIKYSSLVSRENWENKFQQVTVPLSDVVSCRVTMNHDTCGVVFFENNSSDNPNDKKSIITFSLNYVPNVQQKPYLKSITDRFGSVYIRNTPQFVRTKEGDEINVDELSEEVHFQLSTIYDIPSKEVVDTFLDLCSNTCKDFELNCISVYFHEVDENAHLVDILIDTIRGSTI